MCEQLYESVFPQIQSMMLNDAYFKLVKHYYELTNKYNEPIASLIINGYVTYQMIAIRRFCDDRRDVVSLHRVLLNSNLATKQQLIDKLKSCDNLCQRTSDHIAHTGNPARRPNMADWQLSESDLTEAQKSICEVAIALDRAQPNPRGFVRIIPVVQQLDMHQFEVSSDDMRKFWEFWHGHSKAINSWATRRA
jgi:hypothetical protein